MLYQHLKIAHEEEEENRLTGAEIAGGVGLGLGTNYALEKGRGLVLRPWVRQTMTQSQGTQAHIDQLAATRPNVDVIQDALKTPHPLRAPAVKEYIKILREHDPAKAEKYEKKLRDKGTMGQQAGPHFLGSHHTKRIFDRDRGYAYVGDVPRVGITAHELGHAKDPGKILKYNRDHLQATSKGLMALSIPTSIGAAFSENKNVRRAGIATPWIAAAPLLLEEGRANVEGWKSLNKLNLDKKTLRGARGDLLKSYGAYMALPAIASIGAYATGKYVQKKRQDKEKERRGRKR